MGYLVWMELLGLEIAMGESVSEPSVNVTSKDMTVPAVDSMNHALKLY